ncbi:HK97 gp10 family phage protein [Lactobacillus sp. PSON]|uniref:HK97 gp10 family phage protein n=1 Tax=Lactobacillus sp. PSON TaxID=3455454 RepID=UPI0040415240
MNLGSIDDAEYQAWANRVKGKIAGGDVKRELEKTGKNIGVQSLKVLKNNTPVDSGGLRRAWTAEGPSYGGRAWTIKLINNMEYASFVEEGHRQTPGRYVPAIGKRLVASWVPGQFFMKKSMSQIEAQLPNLISPGLWAFRDLLE